MSNQSAFPWAIDDGQKIVGNKGMTLRDYFAAKAMQGIVSRGIIDSAPIETYANNAYKMADAMLKAREA